MSTNTTRTDVYSRVTDRIIADLEHGVRTWLKPWNAGNTEGRITRPLRHTNKAEMIATVRSHLHRRQKQPRVIRNLFLEKHIRYAA